MGYKIPDLKEDLKEAIRDYICNGDAERWRHHGVRADDIDDIIDKRFEKIER